jgi:uncharacterized membrane protein YciS (DUF1049 family)
MVPSQPTSEPTEATERQTMSLMSVLLLIGAAVCTTLVVVDCIASSTSAWDLSREVAALFRASSAIAWVVFFATYLTDRVLRRIGQATDRLLHRMEQRHEETCERAEKMHRDTREAIAGVSVEVAVAREQNQELRELVNKFIAHVESYGDSREIDGRIATIREFADRPQDGMNGTVPRPLRPARPATN